MTAATTLAAALAATALTLAACRRRPPPPASPSFPTLKSGQWEMTTTSGAAGSTPRKATICLDASTQKAMLDMSAGMQKEMCTRMDIRRDGSKFITDAECRLGESVVKSHGVMTMIGDSAYRTESSATFDPPAQQGPARDEDRRRRQVRRRLPRRPAARRHGHRQRPEDQPQRRFRSARPSRSNSRTPPTAKPPPRTDRKDRP